MIAGTHNQTFENSSENTQRSQKFWWFTGFRSDIGCIQAGRGWSDADDRSEAIELIQRILTIEWKWFWWLNTEIDRIERILITDSMRSQSSNRQIESNWFWSLDEFRSLNGFMGSNGFSIMNKLWPNRFQSLIETNSYCWMVCHHSVDSSDWMDSYHGMDSFCQKKWIFALISTSRIRARGQPPKIRHKNYLRGRRLIGFLKNTYCMADTVTVL